MLAEAKQETQTKMNEFRRRLNPTNNNNNNNSTINSLYEDTSPSSSVGPSSPKARPRLSLVSEISSSSRSKACVPPLGPLDASNGLTYSASRGDSLPPQIPADHSALYEAAVKKLRNASSKGAQIDRLPDDYQTIRGMRELLRDLCGVRLTVQEVEALTVEQNLAEVGNSGLDDSQPSRQLVKPRGQEAWTSTGLRHRALPALVAEPQPRAPSTASTQTSAVTRRNTSPSKNILNFEDLSNPYLPVSQHVPFHSDDESTVDSSRRKKSSSRMGRQNSSSSQHKLENRTHPQAQDQYHKSSLSDSVSPTAYSEYSDLESGIDREDSVLRRESTKSQLLNTFRSSKLAVISGRDVKRLCTNNT